MLRNCVIKLSIFAFVFNSFCNYDNKVELEKLLREELGLEDDIKEAYIFFLTDQDCKSCSEYVYLRINTILQINPNKRKFGLYLTTPKNNLGDHKVFIESTKDKISWFSTNNTKLFGLVSQSSDKHHSPFLIEIRNSKIRQVTSLGKN
ncbi:MAG: hypothetical protein QXW79_04350 [Thermoplasmata archaeon]